jgi:hypothetical protein
LSIDIDGSIAHALDNGFDISVTVPQLLDQSASTGESMVTGDRKAVAKALLPGSQESNRVLTTGAHGEVTTGRAHGSNLIRCKF